MHFKFFNSSNIVLQTYFMVPRNKKRKSSEREEYSLLNYHLKLSQLHMQHILTQNLCFANATMKIVIEGKNFAPK